jgi:glycosyltransferase involved in cell wall biosynthesis
MGKKNIVIGIPSYNEETTILHVLSMASMGLQEFYPEYKSMIVVADGGSTDRTVRLAKSFRVNSNIEKKVVKAPRNKGKGATIKKIMQIAKKSNASMLGIIDSDLISIKPSWIDYLLRPIAFGLAEFTVSRYLRDKHDGGITKLLTYPMITMLWSEEIRQPMGGEVGMSSEVIDRCLEHPLFPDDFGIDTFLTTVALANDLKIQGGILDAKFHESTSKYIEPKKHLLGMFHQVTTTLFEMMIYYENEWQRRIPMSFHHAKKPRKLDKYKGPRPTPVSLDQEALWKAGNDIIEGKKRLLKEITGDYSEELKKTMEDMSHLDGDMWAETVIRAASAYKRSRDDKIIEVLGGVWLGRYATYAESTKKMNLNVAELDVHKQMLYFLNKRDLLMEIY